MAVYSIAYIDKAGASTAGLTTFRTLQEAKAHAKAFFPAHTVSITITDDTGAKFQVRRPKP